MYTKAQEKQEKKLSCQLYLDERYIVKKRIEMKNKRHGIKRKIM
jgi:hypothetical protein